MIFTATDKKGITTRFFIGCEDRAKVIADKLKEHGYTLVISDKAVLPKRPEEEKNRATRILGELFGN